MERSQLPGRAAGADRRAAGGAGEIGAGVLGTLPADVVSAMAAAARAYEPSVVLREIGVVRSVDRGIARVDGLSSVSSDEVVLFPDGLRGFTFNLDPDEVGVVLLGPESGLQAGDEVRATGRPLEVPVGEELLGRVVDGLGVPLDGRGRLRSARPRPVDQPVPAVMDRAPVEVPLQTGIKVIDALVPIGRGQRELIIGDRQTGKSAVALDTIINQAGRDVLCVYCAIGQRNAAVARATERLQRHGALRHTIVVVASGEDPPGLRYVAPYAATTMAEHFVAEGRDVLIVYDDLTKHARAYRELSLLLRRPPGREGYPGDIFHIHARLLERSTRIREERGGGSLTALPVVETQAGNIAAYIPTNLISITDGQIYLAPHLFHKGQLPAVDVGLSVSRVGGAAQLAAYRAVVGALRLTHGQFEELEIFSRFATQLDEETRRILTRGRRIRELLKQPVGAPVPVEEQIAVLLAGTAGLLDDLPAEDVARAEARIRRAVAGLPAACARIRRGDALSEEDRGEILAAAASALADLGSTEEHGDAGSAPAQAR